VNSWRKDPEQSYMQLTQLLAECTSVSLTKKYWQNHITIAPSQNSVISEYTVGDLYWCLIFVDLLKFLYNELTVPHIDRCWKITIQNACRHMCPMPNLLSLLERTTAACPFRKHLTISGFSYVTYYC